MGFNFVSKMTIVLLLNRFFVLLWQIRNAFYSNYTRLPETVRFYNGFNKERLQAKLNVHRAIIKLFSSV